MTATASPAVNPITDAEADGAAKEQFDAIRSKSGLVVNMYRAMGHAPAVLAAVRGLGDAIRTGLNVKLRELAYLKAVRLDGCHYCIHYHGASARRAGVTDAQMADIDAFEGSPAFDDTEKDVLRFAEQWTRAGRASPEVVGRLAGRLSASELVVLSATVAMANLTARFNTTFDVPLP